MTDINEISIGSLHRRYQQAKGRIEKLEAALQFYGCGCNVRCADFKKNSRCGYTARNALEETK